MRVLVTGGGGYLGSVLVPKLLGRGHEVRIVDLGYFGLDHLKRLTPRADVRREDLRALASRPELGRELLAGCDAVIHLAAISNDPSADLHPELTEMVNVGVTITLAELAREQGAHFLFSSSCSIYGEAEGEIDEHGATHPLTVYASSKVQAERALAEMAGGSWHPTVLRNGTLYGYSSRMRFDLVVNIFSFQTVLYNRVKVFGDGIQWRPFLHVADCARAFMHFMEHPEHSGVFNIAHENLRVIDLVDVFRGIRPSLDVEYVPTPDEDRRNYRVSAARMRAAGFQPRTTVAMGSEEMTDAIVSGLIADPESIFYRNAKWLKELTQIGTMEHRELVGLIELFKHAGAEPRG